MTSSELVVDKTGLTSSFGDNPFRSASFLSNELPTICMYKNTNQTS